MRTSEKLDKMVNLAFGGHINTIDDLNEKYCKVIIYKGNDNTPIEIIVSELPKYSLDEFIGIFTPEEYLALLLTNGLYVGFHDKMAFAITTVTKIRFVDNGLLGLQETKPHYKNIKYVLKESGF